MPIFSSTCPPPFSSSSARQQEGPPGPYDAGPAQGFFLLTQSFSLPLLLVAGRALGFCKGLRDNFDCDRCYMNT